MPTYTKIVKGPMFDNVIRREVLADLCQVVEELFNRDAIVYVSDVDNKTQVVKMSVLVSTIEGEEVGVDSESSQIIQKRMNRFSLDPTGNEIQIMVIKT